MCFFLLYLYFLVTGLYPSKIGFSRKRQNVFFIFVFVFYLCLCVCICICWRAGLCPPKIGFSRKRQKGPKKLRADPFTRKNFNDWIHSFARSFNGNCIGSAGSEYKSDQGLNIHYIHLYSSHFHLYSRLLRFNLKKCQ